jgi:HAE1 family hydrophobic/amphiphilic exporter-1
LSVNHFGQLPAVTISFNLGPGFALGEAAESVKRLLREMLIPPTVSIDFQGTVKEFQQSFRGLSILLIVAFW